MASRHCMSLLASSICRRFAARYIYSRKIWEFNRPVTAPVVVRDASTCPPFHHHWTASRVRHLRGFFPINILSPYKLSTKAGAPYNEGDYQPLEEYNFDPEPESKEVFIVRLRGLPWSCTPMDVVEFFSECQIRDGVNGIHLAVNMEGKPDGQALVELEKEIDVLKALEKHRQFMGSRYVEVYEATSSEAEAILRQTGQQVGLDGVVKLRGLPYDCTEKDVAEFFSDLEIVPGGVTFVKNRTGKNTGFAYVEFASQEMANQALNYHRETMGSRYIEVFPSRKSDVLSQRGLREEVSPSLPAATEPYPYPENRNADPVPRSVHYPRMPAHRIHMRGLPFQATGQDIVKFFLPVRLVKILIEYNPTGRASGHADVYFASHEDAIAAMSKDKAHMHGRYIELFLNSLTTKE